VGRCLQLLRREFDGTAAEGWLLYAATVTAEAMLGATTRWLLVYLGVGALASGVAPGSRQALAWLCALGPLAWSGLALIRPVDGSHWRRLGARPANKEERVELLVAMADLWQVDWQVLQPDHWYVLDVPLPAAMARGRDILVTSGLMRSSSLPAVIAHELGHVHSVDARLRGAAARLVLWRHRLLLPAANSEAMEPAAPLFALARIISGLAGGCLAAGLLDSHWHAYRYAREYAADAYAASLGQARTLTRFLVALEQSPNVGMLRLLTAISDHPPMRSRVARLHEYAVAHYPLRSRPLLS
jgi:Zn-dependent protease with chaperone function